MTKKIAVVGAGSMAREHIRAFASLPGVEIAGIHSRTRSRAEELAAEFAIPVVSDDIASLHGSTGADLVIVAVPELAANGIAKAVLRHPWAILLEKPAGYDLDDAVDIAKAAGSHGAPVMVAFNRRFYSSTRAILNDINFRDERRFVHIQDQQSFAEARRYNHPEQVVEKFMYANSIHVIDLIPTLCRGKITQVTPVMPWRGGDTEVVLAHVAFDSGDAALYEGLWQGPGPWACSVSTPSRRWVMQPLERATYQNAGERKQNQIEPDSEDIDFKSGFKRQAEAVIGAMKGSGGAVTIQDSLETMRLINRIFGV